MCIRDRVEGNTVALCDIKQEWAENGLAKIKKGYEKLVAKGKMTQEKADAIVAAITPGLKEDLCADCDLVVEAAFEDMKVKQTTFGELDKICKPECIFASNTSSLSITEIGKGVSRPLVGMHFFNPADRMKLIEVIAGCNTPACLLYTSVLTRVWLPCASAAAWAAQPSSRWTNFPLKGHSGY